MRNLILALLVLSAFVLGMASMSLYHSTQKPTCITEDMCRVDYRNDEWHITELQPGQF